MLQDLLIRNLCNLEKKIISVERILQYSCIPSELALMIEATQPNHSWPSHGEVNIRDLQVKLIVLYLKSYSFLMFTYSLIMITV